MRFVLDTNTRVSGLLWHGTPQKLLACVSQKLFVPYTCQELLTELLDVLTRPKFAKRLAVGRADPQSMLTMYRNISIRVSLPSIIPLLSRDPKDDIVLACAQSAQADAIISGDKDLLVLRQLQGVHIWTPREALNVLLPPSP